MTSFRQNLVANFVGVGWSAAVNLVCVPFYIRFMGIESYALVGFFATLQATLQMFDLGATPTMNRELARAASQPERAGGIRSFVRTLEATSWATGLAVGGLVTLLARPIATRWIGASMLPQGQVASAVMAMGGLIALQWPVALYQGGLQGLQRQVPLNALRVAMATASSVGGVMVLRFVSADIDAFFAWQLVVSVAHLGAIAVLFSRSLASASGPARIDFSLLRPVLGFAGGVGGTSIFGLLLLQMDKLVLSKLLSLEAFGYYVLAGTVANGLQLFIRPLYTAIFPRLSALVAAGDGDGVRRLYHQGSQLMAVLVFPAAAVLVVFPHEVLAAWTGDPATAAQVAPIVRVLVAGTAIFAMMHLPYALQLAYGWTSIGLGLGAATLAVLLPLLLVVAARAGAVGAAGVWVLLNVSQLAISLPWTHARLMRGDAGAWLWADLLRPLAGTVVVAAGARLALPALSSRVEIVSALVLVGFAAMAAALGLAPEARRAVGRLDAQRTT